MTNIKCLIIPNDSVECELGVTRKKWKMSYHVLGSMDGVNTRTIMIVALNQAGATEPRSMPHRQGWDERGLNQL
jgi:hypothetical protein